MVVLGETHDVSPVGHVTRSVVLGESDSPIAAWCWRVIGAGTLETSPGPASAIPETPRAATVPTPATTFHFLGGFHWFFICMVSS
jgi:hypothetical protein